MATRRVPTFQTIVDPALLDRALGQLATYLQTNIAWMDRGFGLAQKLHVDGGTKPVIYEENGLDHFSMYPNENLGNFCYFERTEDRTEFWRYNQTDAKYNNDTIGLIVWGDLRQIYPADWQQRTREHVRAEITDALTARSHRAIQQMELLRYWYEGVNIYRNHTITEIESQYLMRPYVGFRLDFEIIYNNENFC